MVSRAAARSLRPSSTAAKGATPSLETWVNAEAGKYARLDLPERFGVAELPEMAAIDLRIDPTEAMRAVERGLLVSNPAAGAHAPDPR